MGVMPVLFASALLHFDTAVALYEDGSFVPLVTTATFERIIRSPRSFEVQYCKISGPRAIVYSRYATMLLKAEDEGHSVEPRLLTVVRPLYKLVKQLPEYVTYAQELSEVARAVHRAIRDAKQPDHLLFVDLPVACGRQPFGERGKAKPEEMDAYFGTLRSALVELQQAYPNLVVTIEQLVLKAFSLGGLVAAAQGRAQAPCPPHFGTLGRPKAQEFSLLGHRFRKR